eukprot:6678636-Heterocapsa_arctica.AAC.1
MPVDLATCEHADKYSKCPPGKDLVDSSNVLLASCTRRMSQQATSLSKLEMRFGQSDSLRPHRFHVITLKGELGAHSWETKGQAGSERGVGPLTEETPGSRSR